MLGHGVWSALGMLAVTVGFLALAWQASTQAWSMATGSKEANIPMSGRIGASFSAWQSQLGEMSRAILMKKDGRPLTIAAVYSAILRPRASDTLSKRV